jgi:hypothetical protein
VAVALATCLLPTSLHAHDAFGDLGPFYANLLHPLADPLQAALLVGTAAFLASRPLSVTRLLLPVFAGAATLGALALAAGVPMTVLPVIAALAALLVGLSATVPDHWMPRPMALCLVAATGALTGLAPGALDEGAVLQPFLGTALGIAVFTMLTWFALETAGRRFTPLVPQVAGSWVAAVGILVVAFST